MKLKDKKISPQIVVGAVVIKNGQVLILKRSASDNTLPGLWELPSGKKKPPETVRLCLIREVKEEAGILIKPIRPLSVFEYRIEKEAIVKDCVQINYLSIPEGKLEIRLSSEHEEYAWISKKDLNQYNLSDEVKKVIGIAFNAAASK